MLLSSLSVLHKLSLWDPFSLQKHTFVIKSLFVELLFVDPLYENFNELLSCGGEKKIQSCNI